MLKQYLKQIVNSFINTALFFAIISKRSLYMRFLLFLTVVLSLLEAKGGLEVTSKDFVYKEGSGKAEFIGEVLAKNGETVLNSDKLVVILDKDNEAKKYIATGHVSFNIKNSKKKRDIKGTCQKVTHIPKEDKYILVGNVVLHDMIRKRDVYGDEVVIDNKLGTSRAKSHTKKPVKFIFNTGGK